MPSSSPAPRCRPRAGATLLALVGVLIAVLAPAAPAVAAPATVTPGSAIEGFAPYQGQTACDPVARPGVVAFRDLVLASYPGTGDSGIVRACSIGGTSEHKEGRAWDWRVSASNPTHVAQVDDLMSWLLATDEHGNPAAMARRLGVMYVIWDSRVWKSYQAARGWQPYSGRSPHTDHVHVSYSWAGALGATSYWTGQVAPVMQRPLPPPTVATPTATIDAAPEQPSRLPAPTVQLPTELPVMDRRTQIERRRTIVRSLPGPWRRH